MFLQLGTNLSFHIIPHKSVSQGCLLTTLPFFQNFIISDFISPLNSHRYTSNASSLHFPVCFDCSALGPVMSYTHISNRSSYAFNNVFQSRTLTFDCKNLTLIFPLLEVRSLSEGSSGPDIPRRLPRHPVVKFFLTLNFILSYSIWYKITHFLSVHLTFQYSWSVCLIIS